MKFLQVVRKIFSIIFEMLALVFWCFGRILKSFWTKFWIIPKVFYVLQVSESLKITVLLDIFENFKLKNIHLVISINRSVEQIERLHATQLFAPFPCVSSTQLTEYFVCYTFIACLPAYVISIICLLHMGRSVFASTFQNNIFSLYMYDGYSLADNMVFI